MDNSPSHLETERKALITGGASGFGRAIATALAADGARVGLLDVDAEATEAAAEEIGSAAIALPGDVRKAEQVTKAVDSFVGVAGGLDTLVLCAGVIHIKPITEVDESDWDSTLDVNLKGAFLTAQAATPHLVRSGRGRVVAISSDAGRRGVATIGAYCASKFGLIGLMESLALELGGDGVTVNTICPVGCPTTSMGQEILAWKTEHAGKPAGQIVKAAAAENPIGRNATEADITSAAMFFLGSDASFLTGVTLDVDGGLRLGSPALPGTG